MRMRVPLPRRTDSERSLAWQSMDDCVALGELPRVRPLISHHGRSPVGGQVDAPECPWPHRIGSLLLVASSTFLMALRFPGSPRRMAKTASGA